MDNQVKTRDVINEVCVEHGYMLCIPYKDWDKHTLTIIPIQKCVADLPVLLNAIQHALMEQYKEGFEITKVAIGHHRCKSVIVTVLSEAYTVVFFPKVKTKEESIAFRKRHDERNEAIYRKFIYENTSIQDLAVEFELKPPYIHEVIKRVMSLRWHRELREKKVFIRVDTRLRRLKSNNTIGYVIVDPNLPVGYSGKIYPELLTAQEAQRKADTLNDHRP